MVVDKETTANTATAKNPKNNFLVFIVLKILVNNELIRTKNSKIND